MPHPEKDGMNPGRVVKMFFLDFSEALSSEHHLYSKHVVNFILMDKAAPGSLEISSLLS